jgi:hypothetical protein
MHKIVGPYGKEYPLKDILSCVGPGWHPLVIKLIEDLFSLGWDGELHQIKEKFAGLRFYIGGGSKEIFDRINKAEDESLRTCDTCGKPGKLRSTESGWWYTSCEECVSEKNKPLLA